MGKRIYFCITTHPNMNYDRSLKSVIRREFPKLYRLYLNYLKAHPHLKSYMQLPSQTLLSLKQCAPDVLDLSRDLATAGRLRYMGTFFSEPLAQCMDGMSALESAQLGCETARRELGSELEGFFLQEIAYTPQIPYIINRVGVGWHIIKDWEGEMAPYTIEGLDGSRCVAVPIIDGADLRRVAENPDLIPDNALLTFHCDMEIPAAIQRAHQLSIDLAEKHGRETHWCFVNDYLREMGAPTVKRPTPCTNKREGSTESPSYSRWISDPLDIRVHEATMAAFEARRTAALVLGWSQPQALSVWPTDQERPYPTRDVETLHDYPELGSGLGSSSAAINRVRMLLAWGTNSDARGWYPLL